ncbi:MAG: pitrilysin family protein [Leeuwenhoekiella sp.]
MKKIAILSLFAFALISCNTEEKTDTSFKVDYDEFTLDNGLTVIFHEDKSDPVVAVALTAHVGSAREKEGRTGFAHLFEHLLFLESENLGKGGLDKLTSRVGGSGANGSTNRDRTNYFQTVPKDALEKMIWAEADKLGYFINTVTEPVLAKEKQVVKNEKRQSVDNNPYGHQREIIHRNLYPSDHPYNWEVIGSLEDLQNATLADVKEFYRKWYVPNNVTLTIAGDFDKGQAKEWVKKYFDEIPRGEDIPELEKEIPALTETKEFYYEDNFARLPQLTMTWPGPYAYHPDTYPLSILATYLSDGKEAPFYKVLVEKEQLTTNPYMFSQDSELAGEITIQVRGNDGVDLDSIAKGIQTALTNFEANGISEKDLKRIQALQETRFYNSLNSVLGKGFQLAQYNIFAGDPGYINKDVDKMLAVTTEDVMRVYEKYIKNKNFIATSFVPKGEIQLALANSEPAEVEEEKIVEGAEETFDPSNTATYERTPSSFDRTIEPPYGESPEIKVPEVWRGELENGLGVLGIENAEVPLVNFTLTIDGGQLLENQELPGVVNLLAEMMTKGTATKTPVELEQEIELLGSYISINAEPENITISGTSLAKNYDKTMALVEEMILEPRWDEEEFKLAKKDAATQIEQQLSNPRNVADNAFAKAIYGSDNILSQNILGTSESIDKITLEDLKSFYKSNFSPSLANLHVVGAIDKEKVMGSLTNLEKNWESKNVAIATIKVPEAPEEPMIYFIDVPGAKQSQLRIGYPALAANDPDFYNADVMNYRLGGGGFASQLTQELRETKGYTYGVRSRFEGNKTVGPFVISSGVRSNVTSESLKLIDSIITNYSNGFTENDLELSKNYEIKSSARSFETANAKLNFLEDLSTFNFENDYMLRRQANLKNMDLTTMKALATQYINPKHMIYVVAGDAKTQLQKLKDAGIGDVKLVNENLNPVSN